MAQQKAWHKLDNTANLFPVIAGRRTANVFRMTAVMRDEVVPEYLQQALEQTLPAFAAFGVRLRHGLFWSYLEQNDAPVRRKPTRRAGTLTRSKQGAIYSVYFIFATASAWKPFMC